MENNTVKEFYEWLIEFRDSLQDSAEATTTEVIRIHYKNMFRL